MHEHPSHLSVSYDFTLIFFAVAAVAAIFWLVALIHCLRNQKLRDVEKLIWVVVILSLNVFGTAIYVAIGRNPRN